MSCKDSRVKSSALPYVIPKLADLNRYQPSPWWFLDRRQAYGSHHDIGHLTRVLILGELISNKISERMPAMKINKEALRWASVTHDVRKKGDYELNMHIHGIRASEWVAEFFATNDIGLNGDSLRLLSQINYYHSLPSNKILEPIPPEILILRDADSADMLRITELPSGFVIPFPLFIRSLTYQFLCKNRQYKETMELFPFAKRLVTLSKSNKKQYSDNPYASVMSAAIQLGMVKE